MNVQISKTKYGFMRIATTVLLSVTLVLCFAFCAACGYIFVSIDSISAVYNGGDAEVGSTLNRDDIVVTAQFSNNTTKTVTGYSLDYDFSTAGLKQVTVTYKYQEEIKTAEFNVNVVDKNVKPDPDPKPEVTLERIEAVYAGENVKVGGTLNNADITVTAFYSNGSSKSVNGFTVSGFTSDTAGQKDVTVTYVEDNVTKTCAVKITVEEDKKPDPKPEATLESIEAVYVGETVKVGGTLKQTDITVTAHYSDNTEKTVTEFTVAGFDSSTAGEKTVTITFTEVDVTKTCTVTVCVAEIEPTITLESVSAVYNGQNIIVGGALDKKDIAVTAHYSNQTEKSVTEFSVTGFDLATAGDKTVTVVYTENGVTKTCTVTVTVENPPVLLESITAQYNGQSVKVGAALNNADIAVTAYYSNGTTKTVEGFTVSGFTSVTAGQKDVTVTYAEDNVTKTCTVKITVEEEEKPEITLERIEAVYSGENVKVGGTLNNADITVTVYYSDGSSKVVGNFTVGNFSAAVAGVQQAEISYTEGETTKNCYVSVTVVEDSQQVISNSNVSIHFLELGNKYTGDSVYIKVGQGENAQDILIDAGSQQSSAGTITDYINDYVEDGKLEYVIATHAHQDHIAGFVGTTKYKGIFEAFECDTIIDFSRTNQKLLTDKGNDTLYAKYVNKRNAAVQKGANHYTAEQCFNESVEGAKRVYELADDVTLEILYNYFYFNDSSDENNYSVCCILKQGENNYFFSGDLEKEGEEKLVDYYNNGNDPLPHCVLYKAGHHGSKTSSTAKLMEAISPEYVCVCCCAGTSEYTSNKDNQFPTQDFINRVAPYTDKVYVTTVVNNYVDTGWASNGTVKSMNGNIVFSCINGEISVVCSNNNLVLKDTEWFKKNRDCPPQWLSTSN